MALDASKMPKWLGITNQQFSILEAMLSLEQKRSQASPKAIIEEEASARNAPRIQKSNFFAQLKSLRELGYVSKLGGAAYAVDYDAITGALQRAEGRVEKEAAEIVALKSQAERQFKGMPSHGAEASVSFIEQDAMYGRLADAMRNRGQYYATGVFPKIFYAQSPSLMQYSDSQRYAQTLWLRCVSEHNLEIVYLTSFDVEYLFDKLSRVYKSPTLAYQESKIVIESIPAMLEKAKCLTVYYTDTSYSLDMLIPYEEHSGEVFLMIRDVNKVGQGCVYIRSPELVMKFRDMLLDECKESLDMRDEKAGKVISKLESKLEIVYQKARAKRPRPPTAHSF